MIDEESLIQVYPEGEWKTGGIEPAETALGLDTFAGKIQLKWSPDGAVSTLGPSLGPKHCH
jgi:hypothetical protein